MSENFVNEGEVLKIASSKTNNGTFYRLEIKDSNGTDMFGLGNEKPDFGEGSIVNFEFEENGKFFNIIEDTLEVIDHVEPKGRGGRSNGGSSRGNNNSGRGGRGNNSNGRGSSNSGGGRGGNIGGRGGNKGTGRGSKGSGGKGGDKGGTDWEAKDKRTAIGFAREQAIKVLAAMIDGGAITLPSAKAKKYDAYLGYLDELTARFLVQGDDYVEQGIEAIGGDYGDGEDED